MFGCPFQNELFSSWKETESCNAELDALNDELLVVKDQVSKCNSGAESLVKNKQVLNEKLDKALADKIRALEEKLELTQELKDLQEKYLSTMETVAFVQVKLQALCSNLALT